MVIALFTKSYNKVVHVCHYNGRYDDAYKHGEKLLLQHKEARYFEVLTENQYLTNFK